MGVPTSEVGYTSAMPRREDHEVRQGHVGHWIKKKKIQFSDTKQKYIRIKKNQLDAQLILRIFRQPLNVSGVSRPIIRRYSTTVCVQELVLIILFR